MNAITPASTVATARKRALWLAGAWVVGIVCLGVALLPESGAGGARVALIAGLGVTAAVPLILLGLLVTAIADAHRATAIAEALASRLRTIETDTEVATRRLRILESSAGNAPARLTVEPVTVPTPAVAAPGLPDQTPAPTPAPAHAPDPAPTTAYAQDHQPDLPLLDAQPSALSLADTIKALNFPSDPADTAGFAILSRALASHDLSRMLQASEDLLNYLAHLGLYMDDLLPAPASADDWRQFAKGGAARAELMPLQGITDTAALKTVHETMRADPVFRDCALHFQRMFDRMLQKIAPEAGDDALLDLVDTRSGRAFALMVQVTGRT